MKIRDTLLDKEQCTKIDCHSLNTNGIDSD